MWAQQRRLPYDGTLSTADRYAFKQYGFEIVWTGKGTFTRVDIGRKETDSIGNRPSLQIVKRLLKAFLLHSSWLFRPNHKHSSNTLTMGRTYLLYKWDLFYRSTKGKKPRNRKLWIQSKDLNIWLEGTVSKKNRRYSALACVLSLHNPSSSLSS
jgi:hypothetical protein